MARSKRSPALNDGHTLHLADEYHPDHRIAAKAADAKALEAAQRQAGPIDTRRQRLGHLIETGRRIA